MKKLDPVEIFRRGSDYLNQWREENPDERLNLTKANLSEASLSGANLSGANLSDASLSGANLSGANLRDANLSEASLSGADLSEASLSGADLSEADLIQANLSRANLSRADLIGANLSWAYLREANLSGADLSWAYLQRTCAALSIVDGKTLLDSNKIDRNTNFSGVDLDGARVEEELKSALKRNIRQLYWEKCYENNPCSIFLRTFWWASDYGSSTTRLIHTFLGISFIFSLVYLIPYIPLDWLSWNIHPFLEGLELELDIEDYPKIREFDHNQNFWFLWVRALYFSIVTMTTLGFGDMSAHPLSIPGHILVCIQVILGYVLLGALITRLSILFQEVQ